MVLLTEPSELFRFFFNNISPISTVSNKETHLAVFETCVFRVYLGNHLRLELQNFFGCFKNQVNEKAYENLT